MLNKQLVTMTIQINATSFRNQIEISSVESRENSISTRKRKLPGFKDIKQNIMCTDGTFKMAHFYYQREKMLTFSFCNKENSP